MKYLKIVFLLSLLLPSACTVDETVPLEEVSEEPFSEDNIGEESIQEGNPESEIPEVTEKHGHWETVTETKPAWDETVLVKDAWTEKILIKDTWDEETTYCSVSGRDYYEGYECACGKVAGTLDEVKKHIQEDDNCNSWHNKLIYYGEEHCLSYAKDIIHHDPEYQYIFHEAVYDVIHHDAQSYEKKIWVDE